MLIFRQEVLSQHKSERGGDEELHKEQRDAFTLRRARWKLKCTPSFKQGAGWRGEAQCTQVLGTTHASLECRCRSGLSENRDHSISDQQQRGTLPSRPIGTGPTLPGRQQRSRSGWGRSKLESCALDAQTFASPRAPLLRKAPAQKVAPFLLQSQPLCNIPQFPVLPIRQLLQALQLLKNTPEALCRGRRV